MKKKKKFFDEKKPVSLKLKTHTEQHQKNGEKEWNNKDRNN